MPHLQIGGPVGWQVAPTPGLDGAPGRLGAPHRAAADPRPHARERVPAQQHQAQAQTRLDPPAKLPDRRAGHPPPHAEGPQVPEPLRNGIRRLREQTQTRVELAQGKKLGAVPS